MAKKKTRKSSKGKKTTKKRTTKKSSKKVSKKISKKLSKKGLHNSRNSAKKPKTVFRPKLFSSSKNKVCPKAAGYAIGIVWGAALFLASLLFYFTGTFADFFLLAVASVYPGYNPTTFVGVFVGGLYGFIDGFIGAYIVVWLYNKLRK